MNVLTSRIAKEIKGEKYIYLSMAYQLCKQNKGSICIGKDNGMVGDQNFFRVFHITDWQGRTILREVKNHASFASFSRCFEVMEYINEDGENGSNNWVH